MFMIDLSVHDSFILDLSARCWILPIFQKSITLVLWFFNVVENCIKVSLKQYTKNSWRQRWEKCWALLPGTWLHVLHGNQRSEQSRGATSTSVTVMIGKSFSLEVTSLEYWNKAFFHYFNFKLCLFLKLILYITSCYTGNVKLWI